MLVDFEQFLFNFLIKPSLADVEAVLAKYRFVGRQPIFEQRKSSCLEVRQPVVEREYGKGGRLPARFEFDTEEHAREFSVLVSQHWDDLKSESAA